MCWERQAQPSSCKIVILSRFACCPSRSPQKHHYFSHTGNIHAGTVRQTAKPRHSIHLYYGLAGEPPLSDRLTAIPTRLSQSADPELRRLFSKKNEITKLFEDNFT